MLRQEFRVVTRGKCFKSWPKKLPRALCNVNGAFDGVGDHKVCIYDGPPPRQDGLRDAQSVQHVAGDPGLLPEWVGPLFSLQASRPTRSP